MNDKKVVIITGAAGGIGQEVALIFVKNGFRVALSDVQEESLRATGDLLVANGYTDFLLLPGNLENKDYLQDIVIQTHQKWGRIDVLVNNAAWRTIESIRNIQWETWEKTIRVCLTAPAFLSKWTAEKMEKAGSGVIVNVSSMMSARPAGISPAYIAAKGALESLTAELAITYGRSGIRVVGISPGYIETGLSNDYKAPRGEELSKLVKADVTDAVPLGRGGEPQEVAEAIYWISSEQASYITGTTLVIDGGFKPNFSKYSIKKLQFPDEF